jgi:putative ABC transport system ATP-binding protein
MLRGMVMEIVEIKNLKKIYKSEQIQVNAINGIDLSIKNEEFVVITGTSGSGKSTLIHMIGGVDEPTSGQIWIDGEEMTALTEKKKAAFRRQKIGIVYQFYNLIPILNVEKNITLPLELDGKKVDWKFFDEITEILGITDRLSHMPGELSGGQQQRVAIARALITRPAILLADEPTGNLDKKNTVEIVQLLKEANEKYGQTIIMITHDEEIAENAERKIAIEDGRIILDEVVN